MENAELLQLLRTSPNEGVQAVLMTYGGLIRSIVTRILGKENGRDVEECVSDILFQLCRCTGQFDDTRTNSLRPYLCKIARNTAISHKRKMFVLFDLALKIELEDEFDMDVEIQHRLNSATVTAALNSIPEPDRTIFLRRYYDCASIKEIAGELQLNSKTVENKLYRGKKRLRDLLIKGGVII